MAAVRTSPHVSAMLPLNGTLVDIFTGPGQNYVRDIQKELVPRCITVSGFRWHNGQKRSETLQILRYLTIRKGGVYVHWDALDARSGKSADGKKLADQVAKSHAHAARKHQEHVMSKVRKLFESTPDDVKINFVKSEVFGVENGDPIIEAKHPVMVEMFSQPIVGAMRSFLSFRR